MARSVGVSRERVVELAAELADAEGLERLTLAQVAARLGLRLPSLYNHVDGLAGLQRELARYGLRQLASRLSWATIGRAGDEAVIALAQAYREFVRERPGLYAATVRAPAADDAELQQLGQAAVAIVQAVLAHYRLDEEASIHAVRGLRSIAHGFATIEQAGGFGLALDRDESYLRLLRAFLAGLHAGTAPAA